MAINKINPYLNFDGRAAKAIALYERALGAKVEQLVRFGEMGTPAPAEQKNLVMHACLRIGGEQFMLADAPPGVPVATASNAAVMIDLDDPAELDRRFDALSAGGIVMIAPHDAPWGARFGMLVDAFGIRWMFNCQKKG